MLIDREVVINTDLHPLLIHAIVKFDGQGRPYNIASSRNTRCMQAKGR
jgi:hypothetical protein